MDGKPGDLCPIILTYQTLVQECIFSIEKADSLQYSEEGLKIRIGKGCNAKPRCISRKLRTASTGRRKAAGRRRAASTDAANIRF